MVPIFMSNDDVVHAVEDFLDSQGKDFLKSGIQHHWQTLLAKVYRHRVRGITLKNNIICPSKGKSLHVRRAIFQSALVFFPESFDISCRLSPMETVFIKCQSLFSVLIRNKIQTVVCKILLRMFSV